MVDGQTEIKDFDKTEENRQLVSSFVNNILISTSLSKLDTYISENEFTQHNPFMLDGSKSIIDALKDNPDNKFSLNYEKIHRVLANGNFVLSVSEGYFNTVHSAIYDLYRVDKGKLVEHWDTIESILSRSEWKNDNGKF